LCDGAPAHSAALYKFLLVNHGVMEISRTDCSHDTVQAENGNCLIVSSCFGSSSNCFVELLDVAREIQQVSLYLICVFSHTPSPVTSLFDIMHSILQKSTVAWSFGYYCEAY
jgi:hypothetical protein